MSALRPIDYEHDGVALRGEIVYPEGPGPHPAVMVMHDARGLGGQPRERAERLAKLGYVAFATDMYGGGAPILADAVQGGMRMLDLHQDAGKLRGRVVAGFEILKAQPGVDASRIGALGFCFGGQCVLELARSGVDAKSVISFHGLLTSEHPAQAGEVKAKILVLTGAHDPYAPIEHVEGFREEMTKAGAEWQVTLYSEGYHAFTEPHQDDMTMIPGVKYDPLLDKLSWASCLAMLDATLR
jgi:dienelactone hydrolase